MPVAVSIAYDPNIRSFQVLKAGKVLTTSSLNSRLLSGIINSIPEDAFRVSGWDRLCGMTTSKERTILIEMASGIQKILNSKHPEQALVPLRLLINTVKLFTYENYIVADSTELTQAQVVAEIIDIIVSIEPKRH